MGVGHDSSRPPGVHESTATARGLTVKALSDSFIEDYVKMRELRVYAKYEGAIRVHIVPRLGEVNAEMLTREQVREAVKHAMVPKARGIGPKDRPRGGKEAARTMLGVLRHMITWGSDEGKLKRKDNPASGMEKNLPEKKEGRTSAGARRSQNGMAGGGDARLPLRSRV